MAKMRYHENIGAVETGDTADFLRWVDLPSGYYLYKGAFGNIFMCRQDGGLVRSQKTVDKMRQSLREWNKSKGEV